MIKIKGEGTSLDWKIINSIKDVSAKNIELKNITFECETITDAAGNLFEKRKKGHWIPCSERLPDIKEHHCSEPCIVYCENGAYGFAELEENIFGQVGWNCERDDEYHEPLGKVLAWMPLPEPYQGGETDEGN